MHLIGPEANDIEIVCNEAVDRSPKTKDQENGWQIQFHDDSHFGHGKHLISAPRFATQHSDVESRRQIPDHPPLPRALREEP